MSYCNVDYAVNLLRQQQIVAIPTETVYGLAGDATKDLAVAKIYQYKKRPQFNPLIIHVSSLDIAEKIALFDDRARAIAKTYWSLEAMDKPLTMVLPLKSNSAISKLALAGLNTIAIRVPKHPVALEILKQSALMLAAPSANPSQMISPTNAQAVLDGLPDVPVVDGGQCLVGLESTILDLTSPIPVILRPGAVTIKELQSFLDMQVIPFSTLQNEEQIKAPGMLARHYAPKLPLRLNATQYNVGEALLGFGPTDLSTTMNLSEKGDLLEAAANLFNFLNQLDKMNFSGIAVMPIPNEGLGVAINDRLVRAAFTS